MEKVRNLKIKHQIEAKNSFIYIGDIEGTPAIYTLPHPTLNENNINDILANVKPEDESIQMVVKVQPKLIYPATQEHIDKYIKSFTCKSESYEDYLANDNFLKTSWLDNIIKNMAVGEKIFFEDEEFLIIADYKWDRKSYDNMYLLLIFKDDKLRSLRDFNCPNILKRAKSVINKLISTLNLKSEHICTYFHYRPSYFRAHIHIINISTNLNSFGMPTRNVFLDEAIKNLEINPDYYKKNLSIIDYE